MNPFSVTFRVSLRSVAKSALYALATAASMFVLCLPMLSQGSQGNIRGGVFDQSGGAIVDAMVTVTDVARGVARTLTTDGAGQYVATNLNPGTYTVRAEVKGFKAEDHSGVLVEVGQDIRVDLTLQPGEQTQTVTVTGEVPAIDTTSSTLGGTVSNQSINALPLNGRNFFRLLELRPGVVTQPGASTASSSTNGRRLGADVLLVEGITQFDLATSNNLINGAGKGAGGDASNMLPLDAVQEFNTQQNAPAEYGWRDGSVINVGVKSGTNSIHGSAYAFGRDGAATDAANFFTQTVTPATLEQFGATAGGRIIKNKLFWFAAFEGLRINVGSVNSATIPSDVSLGGNPNLSMLDACNALASANAGAATGPYNAIGTAGPNGAVNPLSARLAGITIDPAKGCTVSPASSTVENVFPFNPTTSTVIFPGNPSITPLNNGLAKIDWNVNDHNHLSAFYYDSESTSLSGGSIQPYWVTTGISKTREYVGSWTWTPNSTWVNDFRAGWAGALGDSEAGDKNSLPANPWPNGYSMNTGVTNPAFGGFPNITFLSGLTNLGVGGRTGARGPQGQFNLRDAVSYLRGSHAFKFGFEYIWVKFNDSSTQSTWGNIAFADLSSFLQGVPANGSIITGNPFDFWRERWYSGFVEDTWRVTSRITLTPGVRYEYVGPPHSIYNFIGTFDPSVPGGVTQVGPGLPHSELYSAEKFTFLPRLGFAWDIRGNGRTVLRAGVGDLASVPAITAIALSTPFGATLFDASGNIVVNRIGTDASKNFPNNLSFTGPQLQAGWNTTGPVFPAASSIGPSCTVAVKCSTGALDPNFKRAKSLQWNLDIQRAITNRLTLDVAYVGNHGYDETHTVDLNAVPVGTGYTPAVIAACVASVGGTTASTNACKVNSAAIVAARPYNTQFPYYDYIERATSGFISNYNALQVTADLRATHGLSFLAAYTYSHALDEWTKSSANTSPLVDPTSRDLQYASSDQDIRHRFRFSPTWLLPGKKSPGQMLEGWSVSATVALQDGFPWDSRDVSKNDWVGTGENLNAYAPSPNNGVLQFWNYSGPTSAFKSSFTPIPCYGKLGGCAPVPTAASTAAAQADWAACQTAAQAPYAGNATQQALALRSLANNGCYIQGGGILTPPAYGTNGNAGRNSFRGPGFDNVDMSVAKNWHFGERFGAQFRAEFFNLFNRPTFALPSVSGVTGGITGGFGYAKNTADSSNAVLGSGGPRHIQFGLKLTF
jgi:hypothetical protein